MRIGSLFGIEIRIHFLFLLLLGWFVFDGWATGGGLGAGLAFMYLGILFGLVVLHELGHSLTAKFFGYRVLDITLHPLGGAARMASSPGRPGHEILISLAGPAVNVAIAASMLPAVAASITLSRLIPPAADFLGTLFLINLILAGFNLLPAFPMDGGRILRGILQLRMGRLQATRIAFRVGAVFAGLMVVAGILFWNSISLALIGAFVYLAGKAELITVERQHAFEYPFEDDWKSGQGEWRP